MNRNRDSLWDILPSNSTVLERDVASVGAFDHALIPALSPLRTSKLETIPDDYIPWLIVEYGLADLEEIFEDPRVLLEQGLQFNRLRGTEQAVNMVFAWLGKFAAKVWQEPSQTVHFPEWQIDLGELPGKIGGLCDLVRISQKAQPVRSRLRRIFHGWNTPVFVLDESHWGDLLSDYSGVTFRQKDICGRLVSDEPIVLSFGGVHHTAPEIAFTVQTGLSRERLHLVLSESQGWPSLSDDYLSPGGFYLPVPMVGHGHHSESSVVAVDPGGAWEPMSYGYHEEWEGIEDGYRLFSHGRFGHVYFESGSPVSVIVDGGDPVAVSDEEVEVRRYEDMPTLVYVEVPGAAAWLAEIDITILEGGGTVTGFLVTGDDVSFSVESIVGSLRVLLTF